MIDAHAQYYHGSGMVCTWESRCPQRPCDICDIRYPLSLSYYHTTTTNQGILRHLSSNSKAITELLNHSYTLMNVRWYYAVEPSVLFFSGFPFRIWLRRIFGRILISFWGKSRNGFRERRFELYKSRRNWRNDEQQQQYRPTKDYVDCIIVFIGPQRFRDSLIPAGNVTSNENLNDVNKVKRTRSWKTQY